VVLTVLCLLLLLLCINTWAYIYLGLGEFPSWAANVTEASSTTTAAAV